MCKIYESLLPDHEQPDEGISKFRMMDTTAEQHDEHNTGQRSGKWLTGSDDQARIRERKTGGPQNNDKTIDARTSRFRERGSCKIGTGEGKRGWGGMQESMDTRTNEYGRI